MKNKAIIILSSLILFLMIMSVSAKDTNTTDEGLDSALITIENNEYNENNNEDINDNMDYNNNNEIQNKKSNKNKKINK